MSDKVTITVEVRAESGNSVSVAAPIFLRELATPNILIDRVVRPAALTAIQEWVHRHGKQKRAAVAQGSEAGA